MWNVSRWVAAASAGRTLITAKSFLETLRDHMLRFTIKKERLMLIMAVHQVPSLTQERYEEVIRRLTNGKSHVDSLADLPFDGLLVHMAGQTKNGFCIVDIFESEDAVARFREGMGTIPLEVGIEEPPEFFPAHTFVSA